MTRVSFAAQSISFTELASIWIETFHEEDYIVVVFDPSNHMESLEKINLGHGSLKKLYESKILTLAFSTLEDAKLVLAKFKPLEGPYCQMYFLGKYITDNIDG